MNCMPQPRARTSSSVVPSVRSSGPTSVRFSGATEGELQKLKSDSSLAFHASESTACTTSEIVSPSRLLGNHSVSRIATDIVGSYLHDAGGSALMWAISACKAPEIKSLLNARGDLTARNARGVSALDIAAPNQTLCMLCFGFEIDHS